MIYFIWLIPILVGIISFAILKYKNALPVSITSLVIVIIYTLIHKYTALDSQTKDVEWHGNYATAVNYYEDWNERVSCRHPIYCTKKVRYKSGKHWHTRNQRYVCGHRHFYDVDYHPEYWNIKYNNGDNAGINRLDYENYRKIWNKEFKTELNRKIHDNDGDMFTITWNNKPITSTVLITEHFYENRLLASHSVFKADKVDSIDVKQYKLFKYPKVLGTNQQVVLGINIPDTTKKLFDYINGYYGSKKQFKLFVCCYFNQPELAAERQHSYWENLNKNEFLVCIGLNKDSSIQWVKSYSWMDNNTLSIKTESFIKEKSKLDLNRLAKWLPVAIDKYWDRKHFKDFDYIDIDIDNSHYTIMFIVTVLISVIQFIVIYKIKD